jgi:hypothetical protein
MTNQDPSITPDMKVATFLKHFPDLEDTLIGIAPPFKKLRNPVLRRSVAKVASLRQASNVARLPVYEVVNQLRKAAGQDPLAEEGAITAADYFGPRPDWFSEEKVVASVTEGEGTDESKMTVTRVVAAANEMASGEILELVANFLPVPGIDLMRKKGFESWSTENEDGVVRTWFLKP